MVFRLANQREVEKVLNLYREARKAPFSVWNEEYPSREEALHDWETGNLYVLTQEGTVIGALSCVPENEMDSLTCWSAKEGREIARIVIGEAHRGKGLAGHMVSEAEKKLKALGCSSIRLSAAISNIPAWKTYRKLGYRTAGEEDMYGSRYFLMEKNLI